MSNTVEERSRWLEIRFYFLCADLIAQVQELNAVHKIFEGLCVMELFEFETIKQITSHMLLDAKFTPVFLECCYLSARLNVPPYFLAKRFRVKVWHIKNNIQKVLAIAKLEGVTILPKLPLHVHKHIQGVFDSIKKISDIGVQYNVRNGTKK